MKTQVNQAVSSRERFASGGEKWLIQDILPRRGIVTVAGNDQGVEHIVEHMTYCVDAGKEWGGHVVHAIERRVYPLARFKPAATDRNFNSPGMPGGLIRLLKEQQCGMVTLRATHMLGKGADYLRLASEADCAVVIAAGEEADRVGLMEPLGDVATTVLGVFDGGPGVYTVVVGKSPKPAMLDRTWIFGAREGDEFADLIPLRPRAVA